MTRDLTRGQELILYSNQVLLIHEHDVCYQNNGNRQTGYRYGNGMYFLIFFFPKFKNLNSFITYRIEEKIIE